MSTDRKRPESIHDVPEEQDAATVNFTVDPVVPKEPQRAATLLETRAVEAEEDEGQATMISAPAPRAAPAAPRAAHPAPRAAHPAPARQQAEPEEDPGQGVEPTSNFGVPSRKVQRLHGPLASFVALPRMVRAGMVVVSGLFVAGVGVAVLSSRGSSESVPVTTSKSDPAGTLAGTARQAMADGKFTAATAAWQAALQLDPANAEAKKGLVASKAAEAGQGTLDQAQKAIDAKQYNDARAILRAVPADSALAIAARGLWTKADHEEAQGLFNQGEDQIHQNQLDTAKATLEKVKPLDDTLYAKLSLELDTAQEAADAKKKK